MFDLRSEMLKDPGPFTSCNGFSHILYGFVGCPELHASLLGFPPREPSDPIVLEPSGPHRMQSQFIGLVKKQVSNFRNLVPFCFALERGSDKDPGSSRAVRGRCADNNANIPHAKLQAGCLVEAMPCGRKSKAPPFT